MLYDERKKLFGNIFPFWNKLTEDERKKLCGFSSEKTYEKGENVHGASGECTGAVAVVSGCLRTYILSEEGREITLYRLFPGDVCMLSASCVIKSITFDVMVDAEEKSECAVIDGKTLSEVLDGNIYAKNFALETVIERFSDAMWVTQQILFMSFDKRLAVFLLDEIAQNGGDAIKLTHEQIAKYMGSAREVVSRMLKYFKSENIVDYSRSEIRVLDKARLRALTL